MSAKCPKTRPFAEQIAALAKTAWRRGVAEFGPRWLYANLGAVPGEANRFGVIWNSAD